MVIDYSDGYRLCCSACIITDDDDDDDVCCRGAFGVDLDCFHCSYFHAVNNVLFFLSLRLECNRENFRRISPGDKLVVLLKVLKIKKQNKTNSVSVCIVVCLNFEIKDSKYTT